MRYCEVRSPVVARAIATFRIGANGCQNESGISPSSKSSADRLRPWQDSAHHPAQYQEGRMVRVVYAGYFGEVVTNNCWIQWMNPVSCQSQQ